MLTNIILQSIPTTSSPRKMWQHGTTDASTLMIKNFSCNIGAYLCLIASMENVRLWIKKGKWLGAIKTCLESLVPKLSRLWTLWTARMSSDRWGDVNGNNLWSLDFFFVETAQLYLTKRMTNSDEKMIWFVDCRYLIQKGTRKCHESF